MGETNTKNHLIKRHHEIHFDEEAHTYTKGSIDFGSVTNFIGKYHEEFNKEKVANKISRGDELKKAKLIYDWSVSAPWGTYIHRLLELYALGFAVDSEDHQFLEGKKIYDEIIEEGWKLFAPELRVYHEEFKLCGTCDLVFINEKGDLFLADWKTCKSIEKTGFMGKRFFNPVSDLGDCKLMKYSLQLSIYQKMIEDKSDHKIIKRELLHIKLKGRSKRIPTDYLETETKLLLFERLNKKPEIKIGEVNVTKCYTSETDEEDLFI